MNCSSYPSIFGLGHKAVANLLDGEVIVEEKVDGSQFTFGVVADGLLRMRSKGSEVHELAPEKMFSKAVATVQELKPLLRIGWLYRCEYLQKPKHNVLAYDRTPAKHLIVFDIERDDQSHLTPKEKRAEAERLGLECVPVLFQGKVESLDQFRALLSTCSVLGSQKIEGVVVKPAGYDIYGQDKKVLLGKFVSEEFKETHAATWTKDHRPPGGRDVVAAIGGSLNTQARWQKALIHLEEAGKLEQSPRDIGLLIAEIPADILKECEAEIKQQLFDWAWPQIRRLTTAGLAEWYKERLLKLQFDATSPQ